MFDFESYDQTAELFGGVKARLRFKNPGSGFVPDVTFIREQHGRVIETDDAEIAFSDILVKCNRKHLTMDFLLRGRKAFVFEETDDYIKQVIVSCQFVKPNPVIVSMQLLTFEGGNKYVDKFETMNLLMDASIVVED